MHKLDVLDSLSHKTVSKSHLHKLVLRSQQLSDSICITHMHNLLAQ